jgi:hypothetical protein
MKPPRRRPTRKAKTPKDIADQFREWRELRAKVSKAEVAATQNKTASVKTKAKGNGHNRRKPTRRDARMRFNAIGEIV